MKNFFWILFLVISFLSITASAECDEKNCTKIPEWKDWLKTQARGFHFPDIELDLSQINQFIDDDDDEELIVKFHLYGRQNIDNAEIIQSNSMDQMFRRFDATKKTKMIIHGWKASITSKFIQVLKDTYLSANDYNIIVIDWSQKSKKFYPICRKFVPPVAKIFAEFIDLLCKKYHIRAEDLHIIGHSLGAHISGVAGRAVRSGIIGRITGLDPALPLFSEKHGDRITQTSANFVDVIHSCGKYLGWYPQIGHVDFYPNKGMPVQPGCGMDILGKCSHRRAWMYFAESIKLPKQFLGVPCDSWENYKKKNCKRKLGTMISMGEHVPQYSRGTYYLNTNKKAPFGRGLEDF